MQTILRRPKKRSQISDEIADVIDAIIKSIKFILRIVFVLCNTKTIRRILYNAIDKSFPYL